MASRAHRALLGNKQHCGHCIIHYILAAAIKGATAKVPLDTTEAALANAARKQAAEAALHRCEEAELKHTQTCGDTADGWSWVVVCKVYEHGI